METKFNFLTKIYNQNIYNRSYLEVINKIFNKLGINKIMIKGDREILKTKVGQIIMKKKKEINRFNFK